MSKSVNVQKKRPFIILGAGGHAKVIVDTLHSLNYQIAGIINPVLPSDPFFKSIPYLGTDATLGELAVENYFFANGLGSAGNTAPRTNLYQSYIVQHCTFPQILHPHVVISKTAVIKSGTQILAGSIIGPDVCIKENVIINTRAIVEHDCFIDSHSHVASGAIICGNVSIGQNTHIGAGATINQGIQIGSYSVIASGAVVIQNVDSNCLVAGVPAKVKFVDYFQN